MHLARSSTSQEEYIKLKHSTFRFKAHWTSKSFVVNFQWWHMILYTKHSQAKTHLQFAVLLTQNQSKEEVGERYQVDFFNTMTTLRWLTVIWGVNKVILQEGRHLAKLQAMPQVILNETQWGHTHSQELDVYNLMSWPVPWLHLKHSSQMTWYFIIIKTLCCHRKWRVFE